MLKRLLPKLRKLLEEEIKQNLSSIECENDQVFLRAVSYP